MISYPLRPAVILIRLLDKDLVVVWSRHEILEEDEGDEEEEDKEDLELGEADEAEDLVHHPGQQPGIPPAPAPADAPLLPHPLRSHAGPSTSTASRITGGSVGETESIGAAEQVVGRGEEGRTG